MEITILRQQLIEIASIVIELVGNEYLYFDQELKVKLTPHTPETYLCGVCVSPANDVYLMECVEVPEVDELTKRPVMQRKEEWHQLEACDPGAEHVISSLYQRMKIIKQQYETRGKTS